MPAYIETWDVTVPDGGDDLSQGDDTIRAMKRALDERLNEDHVKPSDETGSTTVGYHRKVQLVKQASDPAAVPSTGILYTKDTGSGFMELYFEDEAADIIQLTKRGKIKLSSGRLENNTNLTARNAADAADINLIKANASDLPEIPDGAVMATSAAPTVNAGISNKKYVDDKVAAVPAQTGFGAWASLAFSTIAGPATTDGLIVGWCTADNGDSIEVRTDSNATPTTVRQILGTFSGTTSAIVGICCPVKKGDYYRVIAASGSQSGSIAPASGLYFIPLGI